MTLITMGDATGNDTPSTWPSMSHVTGIVECGSPVARPPNFKVTTGADKDKLLLHYPAVKRGTGYVAPVVTLKFGGR
ncbi:MAG: hypothetical protein ACKOD9_21305, partial [Rubrivivax sp.]